MSFSLKGDSSHPYPFSTTRSENDQPTIGMILCKTHDKTIVEYSLRDVNKPIGVSTYQLRDALPDQLQGSLPTIEQLEMELEAAAQELKLDGTDEG